MVLDGTLQHWLNGEPTIPDNDHLELKYWLNGEPYTLVEGEAAPPPVGAIMNQLQGTNLGADLYNGAIIV